MTLSFQKRQLSVYNPPCTTRRWLPCRAFPNSFLMRKDSLFTIYFEISISTVYSVRDLSVFQLPPIIGSPLV